MAASGNIKTMLDSVKGVKKDWKEDFKEDAREDWKYDFDDLAGHGAPVLPENTVAPVVSVAGSVLSVTNGTWTGSATITYTYAWLRDGVAIEDATDNEYTVVADDANAAISVVVTATNVAGSVDADAVDAPPANITAPEITGTAQVGQTLAVSDGTWSGEDLTFAYAWFADDVAIGGATANEYTLIEDDEGAVITATVTATDANNAETEATSAATEAVIAAA